MKARDLPLELHLVKHQLAGAVEQLAQIGTLLEGNERDVFLLLQLEVTRGLDRLEALGRGRGGQHRVPAS